MEELSVPYDLEVRLGFSILYVVLSVGILVIDRHRVEELPGIFRSLMVGGRDEGTESGSRSE